MRKFYYYLLAKGYISYIEQASNKKLIKIILRHNPYLIRDYLNRKKFFC